MYTLISLLAPLLAVIDGRAIGMCCLWILAAALIYWILQWGVQKINPGEPFRKIIDVILVILVCIFLINAVLTVFGKPFITF